MKISDLNPTTALTGSLGEHGVLSRLPTSLKAGLKFALTGADDQHGEVRLRGAADHVRHKASMTGRVEQRKEAHALPTSTVLPLSRSSWLVSSAQLRYHDSRFFSFASRSYFSSVRLSTMPVRWSSWPPMVDLPASTWPMKTMFRCSFVFTGCATSGLFNEDLFFALGPFATEEEEEPLPPLFFFSGFSASSEMSSSNWSSIVGRLKMQLSMCGFKLSSATSSSGDLVAAVEPLRLATEEEAVEADSGSALMASVVVVLVVVVVG
ncbi:hypothetical protein TYRP_005660 [Tyrophagus putrescentiae]|nr:hypothetical protein TYRP_005660 [Tyrophagus putrescentiae]